MPSCMKTAPCGREQTCAGNPFCNALSRQTRKLLCANRSALCYKRRTEIAFSPEDQRQVLLLRRGEIITFRERYNGRQKGIECLKPGDIVGISRVFGCRGPASPLNLYVKVSAEFCVLPLDVFQKFAAERADFASAVITHVAARFSLIINQLEHISLDSSQEKILYTLGTLSLDGSSSLDLPAVPSVTHRELAILAGVNRITATRVLEHLRTAGSRLVLPPSRNKHTRKSAVDELACARARPPARPCPTGR